MSRERPSQPAPKRSYEVFGFTEKDRLYWRISNEHFKEIIEDKHTIIYEINNSSNNYGEFLFISTSRSGDQGRVAMTFYGLGYHEYRGRLLTEEDIQEIARVHLGKELSDDELKVVTQKICKTLKWVDWTLYLEEAIRTCQLGREIGQDVREPNQVKITIDRRLRPDQSEEDTPPD